MAPASDDWHGWNGARLDDLAEDVKLLRSVPTALARIEGKLDAQAQRRWSPTAKSGLMAACVLAVAPVLSLIVVSH